jgi:hypothetical protein
MLRRVGQGDSEDPSRVGYLHAELFRACLLGKVNASLPFGIRIGWVRVKCMYMYSSTSNHDCMVRMIRWMLANLGSMTSGSHGGGGAIFNEAFRGYLTISGAKKTLIALDPYLFR